MIVEAAALVAGAFLLGSGGICWVILRHTKSFGSYEALLMAVHENQDLMIGQNDKILQALKHAQSNGQQQKGAA